MRHTVSINRVRSLGKSYVYPAASRFESHRLATDHLPRWSGVMTLEMAPRGDRPCSGQPIFRPVPEHHGRGAVERFSISNMGSTQSSANLSLCLYLLMLRCPVTCTLGQGRHGLNIELFIRK